MDYKKYSLENLENWLYDAMSCGEATPQEIYDVIIDVVKDNYYVYKKQASEAYELLTLLNNNPFSEEVKELGKLWDKEDVEAILKEREYYEPSMTPLGHSDLEYEVHNSDKILSCDKDDPSPECKSAWNDFWEVDENNSREYNLREAEYYNKRAELDTKQDRVVKWQLPVEMDDPSGQYFVTFPDDLLEAASLKEGDQVEWVDKGDGSYLLRKV